jgi:hypothetical protein
MTILGESLSVADSEAELLLARGSSTSRRTRRKAQTLLVADLAFTTWGEPVADRGQVTVTDLTPATGDIVGGTTVTATGTNLLGATSVTFDGAAGTSLTVNSATELEVDTPAGSVGQVDVVAITPAGSATVTDGFEYTDEG